MTHVLIVCAQQYNGHELWTTLGTLQERGHTFEVISSKTYIEDEVTYQGNTIERTIDDVDPEELNSRFGALMIVSGNMADTEAYWKNDRVLKYVEVTHTSDNPLAAICCSVPTIRHAVRGKRVSFFPLIRSRELLSRAGAILQTLTISVDGKVVTAEHQMATQRWAEAFCDILEDKVPEINLVDSGFTPRGSERMPIPELEVLKKLKKNR